MDSIKYNPVTVAHPGETVTRYLESFGWTQRELSRRTGITPKTVSEICNGKAAISTSTSIALERVFGRPAHFWNNLQSRYEENLVKTSELKESKKWSEWLNLFPLKEMKNRGWISPDSDEPMVIQLLKFLGVSSPSGWESVWDSSNVAFRQTRKYTINEYAISAWVRRIEHLADSIDSQPYNENKLIASLDDVRQCTRLRINEAFENVQNILSQCGVLFVIEPALPKTGISGCTRWLGTKRAIIALTLRYKTDDQIWFSLFHELGHVLLHRKQHSFIVDNADENLSDGVVDPDMQRYEDEANRFAADTLIPPKVLRDFISFGLFNNDPIHEFSEAIGIAPGIVIGRLQHEGVLEQWQGNHLKQTVNWEFIPDEGIPR